MNSYSQKRKLRTPKLIMTVCLSLILSLGVFMACEGPIGPEGEQGPEGPVGPAGDNGSMIYSGQGVPDSDIGTESDYYLDTTSGELYGPKDSDGWGNPIIILAGEDGEDGSQIHAGTGSPNSSDGSIGDFYLDKVNYNMYGPKTNQGWGTPINLKGADGNANVTRYIYPGHDFGSDNKGQLTVYDLNNQQEMNQSAWLLYLVDTQTYSDVLYFSIPGKAVSATYSVDHFFSTSSSIGVFEITADKSGLQYDRIELIRIQASSTEDQRKQVAKNIIPGILDTSNYHEVAEYYGFK